MVNISKCKNLKNRPSEVMKCDVCGKAGKEYNRRVTPHCPPNQIIHFINPVTRYICGECYDKERRRGDKNYKSYGAGRGFFGHSAEHAKNARKGLLKRRGY